MSPLLIPGLDEATLNRLSQRAAEHGRTIESEAKAILVQALPPADHLDVYGRLKELGALKHGWLDGAGIAPSPAGLNWLAGAWQANYAGVLPLPHLYPTPQGGVQAEWSLNTVELTLAIDLENHWAHWHSLDMKSQKEESRELALDKDADWQWLIQQIARHSEGA